MNRYSAFISYNHNPRDVKIARLLQHRLENYRLPPDLTGASSGDNNKSLKSGDVSASNSLNGMGRIFLDKGELEVAGDLNVIIKEALESSDYLIVICSPESRESIWVRREIEFFMQSHSVNNVLTVITAGEPYDVLPEAVLYTDTIDADGNTIRVSREPLSCDYRLPLRQANRQELPRLAAALIGCRYDDLVQRQRSYWMKRQIAALAATAVLLTSGVSYLVWSNHQIRTNYNNTLIEQSLNLAMQSEQALNSGDRLGAIRYALDALPSDEQDRPVVSNAVLALTDALNLYHTPQEENWIAVKQYSEGGGQKQFIPVSTDKRNYLIDLYLDGSVRLWDTEKKSELMAEYTSELHKSDDEIVGMVVTQRKDILMWSKTRLYSVNADSEQENYNINLRSVSDSSADVRSMSGFTDLRCIGNKIWLPVYISDYDALLCIDARTGKPVNEIKLEKTPAVIRVSSGGKYIAVLYTFYADMDKKDKVCVYDAETCSKVRAYSGSYIGDILFDGDDKLAVCGYTERPGEDDYSIYQSFNFISHNKSMLYSTARKHTLEISYYDIAGDDLKWHNTYTNRYSGSPWLEIPDQEGYYSGNVICTAGSRSIICSSTGELVHELEFNESIVSYYNKPDMIRVILYNGAMAYYDRGADEIKIIKNLFSDPVMEMRDDAESKDDRLFIATSDTFLRLNDNYLLQYEYTGADSKWQGYKTEDESVGYSSDYQVAAETWNGRFIEYIRKTIPEEMIEDYIQKTGIAEASIGYYKAPYVTIRNISDGNILMEDYIYFADGPSSGGCEYSGMDFRKGVAYYASIDEDDASIIYALDLETGELRKTVLDLTSGYSDDPDTPSISYKWLSQPGRFSCGIYSVDSDSGLLYYPVIRSTATTEMLENGGYDLVKRDELVLLTVDPESGAVAEQAICEADEENSYGKNWILGINTVARRLLILDKKPEESEKGLCTFSVYDFSGNLKLKSDYLPFLPSSVMITDEGDILTAESTEDYRCILHRYSSRTGVEIVSVDFGEIDNLYDEDMRLCPLSDRDSSLLMLGSDTAVVVSNDDDSPLSRIKHSFVAYDPDSDELILGDMHDRKYGHVPYRSLDEIIKEGNETIRN